MDRSSLYFFFVFPLNQLVGKLVQLNMRILCELDQNALLTSFSVQGMLNVLENCISTYATEFVMFLLSST